MKGHFVVTGGTSAGDHVVEEFVKTGRSVVRVVPEETEIGEEDAGRVPFIVGDPTDDTALIDAGIERAAPATSYDAAPKRLATSSQLTTFHHASM